MGRIGGASGQRALSNEEEHVDVVEGETYQREMLTLTQNVATLAFGREDGSDSSSEKETKPNRKMGHITVVNNNIEEALKIGKRIKKIVKVTA